MFRRFHAGHGAALGFLLALALQRHTLTLLLLALLLGVLLGRFWVAFTGWLGALRGRWQA